MGRYAAVYREFLSGGVAVHGTYQEYLRRRLAEEHSSEEDCEWSRRLSLSSGRSLNTEAHPCVAPSDRDLMQRFAWWIDTPEAKATATGMVVLVCVFTVYNAVCHLTHYWRDELQRHIVRIILVLPIYAIAGWTVLYYENVMAHIAADLSLEFWEALVIYSFFVLILEYVGGEHNWLQYVPFTHPEGLNHTAPCVWFCRKKMQLNPAWMRNCKFACLQFVVVKPFYFLLLVPLIWTHHEQDFPFPYIDGFVYNTTYTISMYALALLYMTTHDHPSLKPKKPLAKFGCVKTIIFFTYWQVYAVEMFNVNPWETIRILSYLTIIEMLIATFPINLIAFPWKEFKVREIKQSDKGKSAASKDGALPSGDPDDEFVTGPDGKVTPDDDPAKDTRTYKQMLVDGIHASMIVFHPRDLAEVASQVLNPLYKTHVLLEDGQEFCVDDNPDEEFLEEEEFKKRKKAKKGKKKAKSITKEEGERMARLMMEAAAQVDKSADTITFEPEKNPFEGEPRNLDDTQEDDDDEDEDEDEEEEEEDGFEAGGGALGGGSDDEGKPKRNVKKGVRRPSGVRPSQPVKRELKSFKEVMSDLGFVIKAVVNEVDSVPLGKETMEVIKTVKDTKAFQELEASAAETKRKLDESNKKTKEKFDKFGEKLKKDLKLDEVEKTFEDLGEKIKKDLKIDVLEESMKKVDIKGDIKKLDKAAKAQVKKMDAHFARNTAVPVLFKKPKSFDPNDPNAAPGSDAAPGSQSERMASTSNLFGLQRPIGTKAMPGLGSNRDDSSSEKNAADSQNDGLKRADMKLGDSFADVHKTAGSSGPLKQYVCDVCRTAKFSDYDEACKHEEKCREECRAIAAAQAAARAAAEEEKARKKKAAEPPPPPPTPKQRLMALLSHPANQVCVDCPERSPRWASIVQVAPALASKGITSPPSLWNPDAGLKHVGCLMCLECSGSHRKLGVHIAFVRSVNLDEWKESEVVAMERGGNLVVNAFYEGKAIADEARIKKGTSLPEREKFIRDKYERLRYFDETGGGGDVDSKRALALVAAGGGPVALESGGFVGGGVGGGDKSPLPRSTSGGANSPLPRSTSGGEKPPLPSSPLNSGEKSPLPSAAAAPPSTPAPAPAPPVAVAPTPSKPAATPSKPAATPAKTPVATPSKPKPELEVKRLSKIPGNKSCPNCGTVSDHGFGNCTEKYMSFVCNMCKTSHQAYSHRVKSLTMSNWSMEEVQKMEMQGGNAKVLRTWLKRAPPPGESYGTGRRPKEGDPVDVFKKFINDAYENKMFFEEDEVLQVPPPAGEKASTDSAATAPKTPAALTPATRKDDDDDVFDASPNQMSMAISSPLVSDSPMPRSDATPRAAPLSVATADDDDDIFGEMVQAPPTPTTVASEPAPAPAATPAAAPTAADDDDIFGEEGIHATPAKAPAPAPAKQRKADDSDDDIFV